MAPTNATVVIPAFNEGARLPPFLAQLALAFGDTPENLAQMKRDYAVLREWLRTA